MSFGGVDLSSYDTDDPGIISDVSYTGLDDTADAFTGSSTLSAPILGSPLPLSDLSGSPAAGFFVGASQPNNPVLSSSPASAEYTGLNADGSVDTSWITAGEGPSSGVAASMSGVSDPPFASAGASTPTPGAVPTTTLATLSSSLAKMGSGFAQMFTSSSPVDTVIMPSGATTAAAPISSTTMLMLVAVAAALILLMARNKGE